MKPTIENRLKILEAAVLIQKQYGVKTNGDYLMSHARVSFQVMKETIHQLNINAGWWKFYDGDQIPRNKAELICLMHSELSEAMEGERTDEMDKHLRHRKNAEVELADLLIRVFDYAAAHDYDIFGAMIEKMAYNINRSDHKIENRQKEGGKKF